VGTLRQLPARKTHPEVWGLTLRAKDEAWCCSCRQFLPLEAFRRREEARSGLDSWCRSCRAERTRQWRTENPEYLAEYNAKPSC